MAQHPTAEHRGPEFHTTRWSMVVRAGHDDAQGRLALAELLKIYWYPLYAFLRRQGHAREDAEDLTQGFFTRLIEKADLSKVEIDRGRFRSYLLAGVKHFAANEWNRERAQKRGGGRTILDLDMDLEGAEDRYRLEPADTTTPELLYDRRWALTLLATVLRRLQQEMLARGHPERFAHLKVFLEGDGSGPSYDDLAHRLSMTPGAVKVCVHRMRSRFRELLRQEVSQTLEDPKDAGGELRYLFAALRGE